VAYPGADVQHFTSNPLCKFVVYTKAFNLILLEHTLAQFSAAGICFTRPFLGFCLTSGARRFHIVSIYDFPYDKKFPQAGQPEVPELQFGPRPRDVELSIPPTSQLTLKIHSHGTAWLSFFRLMRLGVSGLSSGFLSQL
jgi:hypothetical protein